MLIAKTKMVDLEMASKPLVAPGRLRRPQLFLIFGALSFVWLGALMWMMHGMHNGGERLEEQMDFAGADIDSLYGVEDAVKCRISCEEHPRCLAFTYVKTDKACWLKGQGYSAKSNPNTISGSINETLKIARLSALNHSHDDRRAHGQRWRSSNEGEDVPEYEDDAHEEGEDSEGGLEGGLEDGSDYTGFTEQSTKRSPVVLTDEDVERYNDSTTFLGDVRLLVDVSIPVECEEHCLAHGRCVAWTLHKERHLCLLRLVNTSALRYTADSVGGRLTRAQIAERARRLERARAKRASEEEEREQQRSAQAAQAARVERRAGTAKQRSASVVDSSSSSSHRRRSSGNSSSRGNSSSSRGNSSSSRSRSHSRSSSSSSRSSSSSSSSSSGSSSSSSSGNSSSSNSGGNSSSSSSSGNSRRSSSGNSGGPSGGPSEEHRTRDAHARDGARLEEGEHESEDDLEMNSEPELDELDNLALEDETGDDGWLRGSHEDDDADALELVYDGPSLVAPELDEDTAHIFDDTELVGGDVQQLSHTHTVLACRDACAAYVAPPASPPCRAWTLAKEAGRCWLKSSHATRQLVSKAAGRISGVLPLNGTRGWSPSPLNGTMLGAGLPMKHDRSSVVNSSVVNSSVVNSNRLVLSRTPLTSPPERGAKPMGARRAKRTV